jgi:DNA adenine methylase
LFDTKKTIHEAFSQLFEKYRDSIIVVSYSSNSIPNKEELTEMLKQYKNKVKVHKFDHLYSFGNQNHKVGDNKNKVSEYLFVGT